MSDSWLRCVLWWLWLIYFVRLGRCTLLFWSFPSFWLKDFRFKTLNLTQFLLNYWILLPFYMLPTFNLNLLGRNILLIICILLHILFCCFWQMLRNFIMKFNAICFWRRWCNPFGIINCQHHRLILLHLNLLASRKLGSLVFADRGRKGTLTINALWFLPQRILD